MTDKLETIKQAAYQTALRMAELGRSHAAEGKGAVTMEFIDRVIKNKWPSLTDDLELELLHGLYDNYMIGYNSLTLTQEGI